MGWWKKLTISQYSDHFAKFYGWYENLFSYYLAMEYFPHGTLHDYLVAVGSPMPVKEAREVTVQLLEGLGFIHAQNYAHRDLS